MPLRLGGSIRRDRNTVETTGATVAGIKATATATLVAPVVSGGGAGVAWGDTITHGDQLTLNHVGPWSIQNVSKGSETLSTIDPSGERVSNWPSWGRPSWIPAGDYVYNNSLTNYGGVVPSGGMTIDGYFVPAGTWVSQFRNFTGGVYIEGDCTGDAAAFPGVMFRGCRMRGAYGAPGWFNQNGQSYGGTIWIVGCDAGGADTTNMCESIFETQGRSIRDKMYVIRSYLTYATTLVFMRNSGDACIENWCDWVSDFGDSSKHLNGLANSGGQTSTLWLRNHAAIDRGTGSATGLTDVFQMAADGGTYVGTGTNFDGSVGYAITDNYLGGAAYTLQLGYDKANTAADVRNVLVTGNKFTTTLFANSGSSGLGYKGPVWGSYGNTWSGNTWADGPNVGVTIPSSAVLQGP